MQLAQLYSNTHKHSYNKNKLRLIDCKAYNELDDLFKWMDDYISSTVDEKSRPSVTANLVYMDRVVWSGNFGRMSKTNRDSPTQDTIYRYNV